MLKKYISFALAFLFASVQLFAQSNSNLPERPNPPRLVNNLSKEFPNFITKAQQAQLEEKLSSFANKTSNQIVVVIVDDLNGDEPWHYATELGEKWKVGQEKEDNGIVILIKPTGGAGQRKYFIAVGRGLEGVIPDLTARRIEENELVPNFKNGNYYEGLDQTTDVLMSLAVGEYNSDKYGEKNKKGGFLKVIIVFVFIIVFVIIASRRGGGRGGMTMGSGGIWFGGFGGGGFGGGSSGGGSSGGFGGFGGGSFGGGGSGGSW